MNDRNENNNNFIDNKVVSEEDIVENEEESDEESDEESIDNSSCDEEEDNEEIDEESDDNSDETDCENDDQLINLNAFEDSNRLSPNSEPTCYICLNLFGVQEVGSPDSCDELHYFCLDCIEEWSKQINTCPVDRKRFTYIIVRREIGSNVIMKLPIVQNIVPEVESVPEDVTYCEICGRCDREDRLLLCDGCDFGYHCECLSPPLETIPIEEWFCQDCYQRLFGPENNSGLAALPQRRRAIARTGASEVVRQRILARRTQRKNRKTTKRSTKKYRKRKTRRKTSANKSKTGRKRKTRRRKKRKTKKSRLASIPLPAADARTRIASKLGIGPAPKSPFGLPSMKNLAYESIRKITDLRAAAGISHLSMFGAELDTYDPRVMTEDDIIDGNGSVGILARSRVDRLMSSPIKKSVSLTENGADLSTNSSSIDILTEIMSSQELLHSSSRDVRIGRDGSLRLNRSNPLPVRNCPNSSSSSPQRSPPSASNSPQRSDSNSNNSNNGFNYSYGGQSSALNSNYSEAYCHQDIGSIKPSAQLLTTDVESAKVELYSDIESLGDNNNDKEDSDEEEDDQKLVIDDHNCNPKSDGNINANTAQSSEYSEQTTNTMSDTKTTEKNTPKTSSSKPKQQSIKSLNPNTSKTNDSKRRPSIKDLFGDSDDEEEDDSDIRQLLAQQGSINVHYPIKMSIVLKNSLNKKDTNHENNDKQKLNSSQKQVFSNISNNNNEINSNGNLLLTSDCNKWIAVENKEELSVSPSKWKSIETNRCDVKCNEEISCETDVNKWKPIEKTIDESVINDNNSQVNEIEKRVANLLTDETNDIEMSESNEDLNKSKDKCDDEEMANEEEEGEIRDDVMKVRRCRHGRIRREKHKDNKDNKDLLNVKSRHRSRSNESKGNKRESGNKNDSISDDSVEVDVETNVEIKEKNIETKESESIDNENNEKVGWKKLSNTTKNRSYRDGKPKDEELLFREREVPKKLIKKTKPKETKVLNKSSKDSDRHRDRERTKERRHEDNHNNSDAKHRHKHRSEEPVIEEKAKHKRKSDDLLSASKSKKVKRHEDNSNRSDSRRQSKTRSADEFNDKEKDRRRHHHRRRKQSSSSGTKREEVISGERGRRHHRKHSHHSKKVPTDDDLQPMMTGTTTKILRDHSSYAEVTPLDSKEIYAEGDRIVINVNFKRDNKQKSETEEKTSLISEEKKSINDTIIGHKISSKKDDNIFWASPPPTQSMPQTTTTPSTTTITRIEDNLPQNSSTIRKIDSQKVESKSDLSINESVIKKENKPIDELRFLPRSLHQTEVRQPISAQSATSFGPHTPEGDYVEDQFMPTPTQDESQSPFKSNSVSDSPSSQSSQSSPTLSTTKDEVYDPEAPLQSPVDHQAISVTPSSPQKKSVSIRTPLSPKESIKKPSPARRPPSAERQPKYSPKDIPKSSPASSSSHSLHSPFKSPSLLPQRQIKSSPQKPSPQKSTSLMPPPIMPTRGPTVTSSMTSSIAVTAAAIASINPTNLAQLLQMAQTLKTNSTQQTLKQQQSQRLITNNSTQQLLNQTQNHSTNRDHNEVVDMDVESPSPPQISSSNSSSNRVSSTTCSTTTATVKTLWDQIIKSTQQTKQTNQLSVNKRMTTSSSLMSKLDPKKSRSEHLMPSSSSVAKHQHHKHQVISVADNKKQLQTGNKLDQLTVLDDVPSSAVEMAVKEKFIKKLNRQERVIEEVKLVLKPHYQKRTVTKEEYKEILRKSVPKICHSKSGEINPVKIKSLVEGYVKRFKYLRKKSKKLTKH